MEDNDYYEEEEDDDYSEEDDDDYSEDDDDNYYGEGENDYGEEDDDYYGFLEHKFYNTPVDSPNYHFYAMKLVCVSGTYLPDIPEQYRTLELCVAALRTGTWVIKHIPERLLTYDFYIKAVLNNIDSFNLIPENIITDKFITDVYNGKFYHYSDALRLRNYIGKYIFRYSDIVKKNRRELACFPFNFRINYISLIKNIILFNKN